MVDPNKDKLIHKWVQRLGGFVRATPDFGQGPDAREIVYRAYTDFLYADFNSAVFSDASIRAIVDQNEFFPPYKRLSEQLTAWWGEHGPKPAALPYDQALGLTATDKVTIGNWTRQRADGDVNPPVSFAGMLAVAHDHIPGAYRWLVANDDLAASIAREQGWNDDAEQHSAAATRATLDSLRDHPMQRRLLTMYRALLERRAPRLVPMVDAFTDELGLPRANDPAEIMPPGRSVMNAPRPIAELSREALSATYAQAGIADPRALAPTAPERVVDIEEIPD
jgi:hypothetical protein